MSVQCSTLPRSVSLGALFCVVLPSTAFSQPIRFRSTATTLVSGKPEFMLTADFNEDGHRDLAISSGTTDVSVLLGDGRGNFTLETTVQASGTPELDWLAAGDFDNDGHLDLAATDGERDSRSIFFFLGDGNGGLVPHGSRTVPLGTRFVETGDFDEDGNLDLVTMVDFTTGPNRLKVLLGAGDGTFPDSTNTDLPLYAEGQIACGDFNGDQHLDVAIGFANTLSDAVGVLFGNGSGGFAPLAVLTGQGASRGVVAGDLDGDTHLDIVSLQMGDRIEIHEGNGDGTFAPARLLALAPIPFRSRAVLAELDGDGNPDLVYSTRDRLRTYLGDGAGNLIAREVLGGAELNFPVPADFNEDGILDVACVTAPSQQIGPLASIELYLGLGNGRLLAQGVTRLASGTVPRITGTGEFTRDGHLDVLARQSDLSQTIEVLAGDGAGNLDASVQAIVAPARVFGTEIGDYNGDGLGDFVGVLEGSLQVHLGDPSGGFAPPRPPVPLDPLDFYPDWASSDLDAGLGDDLALLDNDDCVLVFLSDGAGDLSLSQTLAAPLHSRSLAVADWNLDSFPDLAVLGKNSNANDASATRIAIFLNDQTGQLVLDENIDPEVLIGDSASLFVVDVDGDGLDDLLLDGTTSAAAYLPGLGNGTFSPPVPLTYTGTLRFLADLNDDGHLDGGVQVGRSLRLLAGDGSGGFTEDALIRLDTADGILLGDFEEDGQPDLVSPTGDIFLNRSFASLCIGGNVNAAVGPVQNVLLVNGTSGVGSYRTLVTSMSGPLEIRMEAPVSKPLDAPFALYVWAAGPTPEGRRSLPRSLGETCRPMPASNPGPGEGPLVVWQNFGGFNGFLGSSTMGSVPAPSTVIDIAAAPGIEGTFFLQGLICDSSSPQGQVAVTNGVRLVLE